MTGPARIVDLLKIMSRLMQVLQREIVLLRDMKPTEMQDLQRDKIVLAAAYESGVKALNEEGSSLEKLNPELHAALSDAAQRFHETLADNERALKSARQVTDRVLSAVTKEVERQRQDKSGYSPAGVPRTAGLERPVSVALDQRS
jgi:hypothetical protein